MDDDNKYGHAYILNTVSPGQVGTVALISGFLAELNCYIIEMSQHDDSRTGNFFARTMFRTSANQPLTADYIREHFAERVGDWPMTWQLHDPTQPIPALILVSKADHCLLSLLYRARLNELNIDVRGIVANHRDLESIAETHGVPFHYLPVTADNKQAQEQAVIDVMNESGAQLLILARYMQILTEKLCSAVYGRAINIHHSFLPGFKGAKPYEQAFNRGVKVIGATAHYVTTELDEGPIIEQVVQRVDNPYSPKDLASVGRDIETWALARAVKLHVERRVFIEGHKTIVFR